VPPNVAFAFDATAVNLMRSQASLAPFAFEASFTTPGVIRASHLTSPRAALTERARRSA
jgi:hypothetical protein